MVKRSFRKPPCNWDTCHRVALFSFALLPLIHTYSLQAQDTNLIDGVTVKGTNVYTIRGDELEIITNSFTLPFEVTVATNGTFTVAGGKERTLVEGQIIRKDGWLVKPDGHIEPIIDHVAMLIDHVPMGAGRVVVRHDGHEEGLTEQMVFPNGLIVNPNGSCTYPGSAPSRLAEGQLFRLDGKAIHVMDAATLINGKVMVQKDGALIYVSPVWDRGVAPGAIGMCNRTLVKADGTMVRSNGSITVLREGHTVLIESFPPKRWNGE